MSKSIKLKHTVVLLVATFLFSKAQVSQSVIMDRINGKDLTNQFVSSLFQDQKGYLWVGTIGGLNKYNGYGFARYRSSKDSTSISNPAVTAFHQIDPNSVFVGTRKGLNIYNYATDNFKRIYCNKKLKDADRKNNIQCILPVKTSEVIVGTADGILMYNPEMNELQTLTSANGNLMENWAVQCMCLDRLGNLWMGAKYTSNTETKSRVFKYSFATQILTEVPTINDSEHLGISEDYLGNIWVSANDGLVCISPGNHKSVFYPAPEGFYSSVAYTHTKDNVIWQCYWSFGLTSFDIDKKEYKVYRNNPDNPKSLMSNKCWALLKDDNDIFWIGSDVGLQKITSKRPGIEIVKKNSLDTKNSFRGNIVTAVLASKAQNNIVFAGIDGEGFSIYDRSTKHASNYGPGAEHDNQERFVNQFIEDENGDVYVLGQNNFQKLSFKNGTPAIKNFYGYQEHYSACGLEDPANKNKIWIGGKAEIFYFDKQTQKTVFIAAPAGLQDVFYSVFANGKYIFFGHKNGLLKVDPLTNAVENIDLPEAGNIHGALVLNDNEVLLSSQFLGLIKYFNKTKKFEILYKEKHDYFSEPTCLLLYKNNVWLAGNGGLTCLNMATKEVTEITTDDGLPSQIIHKADMLDGYFYLGTQEGLAIINPDFQVSHFIAPKIDVTKFMVLTDSTLFGNLHSGDEIVLNEVQNSFRINFTVLDFNLPEKNRFKFKLSPMQEDWQTPVGENFLIFNSLPAGSYKFELLGSNADQIWTLEPFTIKIKIVPPFYKSTWFKILLVALLIISAVIFIYLRLKADHKKQMLLEKIIKDRTAEIHMQRTELLDSITYAQRIQKAIFVGENILKENLEKSFIYYKPKDKVSGDLYWIGKYKDLLIIFAGDCTGHGVPGAMLSIVGTSLLNKIVHEENIYLPGEVLTRLNYLFFNQLSLDVKNVRDGMDASVITINLVNRTAYYSGAKLDGVYFANNQLNELKARRVSIGEQQDSEFITQKIPMEESRMFYLFSDGLKDQHGGPDKKKLTAKRLKEILTQASTIPVDQQRQFISQTISSWKAGLPQTDDMILIGFEY